MVWLSSQPNKLGIIGGMGSWATGYFFDQIILRTDAARDQDHIDMIVLNHASIPDRTEAILGSNEQKQQFVNLLLDDVRQLQELGVSKIAIPCNTSHYFLRRLDNYAELPIIDMIEETTKQLISQLEPGAKVGILATTGTAQAGLYGQAFEAAGFIPVHPGAENQVKLMEIIYDQIKAGRPVDIATFQAVSQELMDAGCQKLVLACTELSYFSDHLTGGDERYVDSLAVLAESSIIQMGKTPLKKSPA